MRVLNKVRAQGAVALLLLALGVLAAKGIGEGLFYATLYSQDFQWSPAVLLSEGRDPYAWYLAGNADGRIILSQEPNYLQILYVLLLPFAKLSWPAAKGAWALCNVAMGVCSALWLARDAGLRGGMFIGAFLAIFAASPFAHVLGNGQQSLLILFAVTIAWRRRKFGGGFALAVSAAKYSFAPPLAIWLALERRWEAMAGAAIVGAAGVAVFSVLCSGNFFTIAFEPFKVSARATGVGLADVMSFGRALGAAPLWVNVAGLTTVTLGVLLLWRARKRLDELTKLALLCQLSLFTLFHHLYDYVLLAPLFVKSLTFAPIARALTLIYVGFFWFIVHLIDSSPVLKTPAAIGAMLLLSAVTFVLIATGSGFQQTRAHVL